VKILKWTPRSSNTLRAHFDLQLDSGIILGNCGLQEKEGSRWISWPSQKYEKRDGTIAYAPIVSFASRTIGNALRDAVLDLIESEGRA
jgi:DNA-binding cell septation regulator SpoVG